jgi:hypothetical protein
LGKCGVVGRDVVELWAFWDWWSIPCFIPCRG